MTGMQGDLLSETERLIVSYLGSNPPEDGMLDKIAIGTGKSRATVLKYLGTLHAKGIIDYRIIGRNKLWRVRQPLVSDDAEPVTEPQKNVIALAARAFEMHACLLREEELKNILDSPETIVFTILADTTIIFRNRQAESIFPGAMTFRELLLPGQAAVLQKLRETKAGSPVQAEIDLREGTGVLRRYLVTFVAPGEKGPAGCIAVIGEDLAAFKRTKRDLASLLSIIRSTGAARTEDGLLRVAMKGIREKLVPASFCAVFLEDMRVAYADAEIPETLLPRLQPVIARCRDTLGTVALGRDDPAFSAFGSLTGKQKPTGAVAVPIIEGEEAIGVILLVLDREVSATDLGNVEIVADEIAGVLKLQRLDRERSEYINTLLAQKKLSEILNSERDEEMLLVRSIESAMDTLGFEMGCVYLKDETDEMIPRVQKNMPESLRKMCVSGVFDSLFERAFAEKTVLYLTPEVPEFATLDPAVKKSSVRTILIIPIRIGETVEGLLNMGSKIEKQYLPVSLENIASLGLQLGTALERSRLARALEKQNV